MADADGQSDGEGSRTLDVDGVVGIGGGSENDQDQDEGDEELDPEALADVDGRVEGGGAQTGAVAQIFRNQELQERQSWTSS